MTDNRTVSQGQIVAPNPIELFWEKNRRWVLLGAGVIVAVLAVRYGYTYFQQRGVDTSWSQFAEATNLKAGYTEDGSLASFLSDPQLAGGGRWREAYGWYAGSTRSELVTQLPEDILQLPAARLAQQLTEARDTPREPLLLWVSAIYSAEKSDWGPALKALEELESRFPKHFLCVSTDYPPQFRPPEKKSPDAPAEPSRHKEEAPKLRPALAGSLVTRFRDEIAREQEFRTKVAHLYTAPEPDPSPEVVVRFAPIEEEIHIKLYAAKAPLHVENFLRLVRESDGAFYLGQRIDEVQRQPSRTAFAMASPVQFHLGLPASREEDRTTWTAARGTPSGTVLEFEVNDLSHFEGMVAAEPEGEGKSSGERFWMTASDAPELDGERVIFGRVIPEDLEKLRRICAMAFADVEMDRAGRGQLQQNVTVESIRVVGD